MNIFLLEDDYLLNKSITQYLRSKAFTVTSFLNSMDALQAINGDFAIMILDIDLPELSGIVVMEEIRKLYPRKPIIMISATTDISMISKAYATGCNDYMKKPFDIRELELKIRALANFSLTSLQIGETLHYQKENQHLFMSDTEVILTPKEQKIFHILIENKGKTVSSESLIQAIWGFDGNSIHLRQLVARLRKKLPENIIQNRAGSGYCIV